MVMKKDRRKRDVKSKLIAAIAMLMVSSIMVVSSSYAWFTLSTAPEVTGISTAIGANGNLEMALLPDSTSVSAALEAILNATGDQSIVEKNTTWGNLVDLSDSSYGLDQIALFPSKLGLSGGNLADYYLGTPKYGNDGRYDGLNTSASTAIYSGGAFSTNGFGVRAVGTASGMSAHELAYRDALASANDAFNRAITQTKNGASQGGSALASLAVSKATGTAEFTQNDVNKLITAYTAVDASLESIETALKQYIIAYTMANGALNETTYLSVLRAMESMELKEMGNYAGTELAAYITNLTDLQSRVDDALDTLNQLQPTGTGTNDDSTYTYFEWEQISDAVTELADIEQMKLNNNPISYYMEKKDGQFVHINELVANMSNLILEVNAGGNADTGIYAQLADFVDDYTTPVTISGVSYGGLTVDNLSATMKVYATAEPAYLPAAKTAAMTYAPNAFSGGGSTLSDFYGYIIDMAFRTNAADSYLQLQTEAVDRIYDNNANTDGYTMGYGSSMSFSILDIKSFSADKLKNLMGFIRVVFFDPENNAIFGYARLDADTAVVTGNETDGYTVTMQLKMWDNTANGGEGTWASSSTITPLQQNIATAVSTLVYLDGETLTNKDVANAELKGTMNIQFSSSADLVPMEYGDLLNGGSETPSEYSITVNGYTLSQKVVAGADYTANVKDFAQYIGENTTVTAVKVTMGGTEVIDVYNPETGDVNVSNVSGDLVVTVTIEETTQTTEPTGTEPTGTEPAGTESTT